MQLQEATTNLIGNNAKRIDDGGHAGLRQLAAQLESQLEQLARAVQLRKEAPQAADTRQSLDEFGRRLFEHFAYEEQRGVVEVALAEAPQFSRRAAQLKRQHIELRTRMEVVGVVADKSGWVQAHESFVLLRRTLLVHEQEEEELLRCIYQDDYGGHG